MKTAISIPDDVFCAAEVFAHQSHMTRSALFTRAVREFLALRRNDGVTERLNRIYRQESSRLDTPLANMQATVVSREKW